MKMKIKTKRISAMSPTKENVKCYFQAERKS